MMLNSIRTEVLWGNDRGSILVSALVLITIMMILGMALIRTSSTELQIAANELRATKAFYLAEAGISHAIAELEKNQSWTGTTSWSQLGDGFYRVVVQKVNEEYIVESEGRVGTVALPTGIRKIRVTLRSGGGVGYALYYQQYIISSYLPTPSINIHNQHALLEGNLYFNSSGTFHRDTRIRLPSVYDPATYPPPSGTTPMPRIDATGNLRWQNHPSPSFYLRGNLTPLPEPSFDEEQLKRAADVILTTDQTYNAGVSGFSDNYMIFVDGNVTIRGSISSKVIIVATGIITINGNMSYSPNTAGPIFLVGLSGIHINNNVHARGLLATPASLTGSDVLRLEGAIIAGRVDTSRFHNGTTVTHDPRLADPTQVPAIFANRGGGIELVSWEEVYN